MGRLPKAQVAMINKKKEAKMAALAAEGGKAETKPAVKDAKSANAIIWKEAMPGLLEQNLRIQKKALDVIEEKIEGVSAAQAATIYGILHDKCQMMIGSRQGEQSTTMNMYFGGEVPKMEDIGDLMQRVVSRMHAKDDTEFEVVKEEKAEEK